MKKFKKLAATVLAMMLVFVTCFALTACHLIPPPAEPTEPEQVLATKIQISDSALSMKIGDEETLTATVNLNATNRGVEWLTSDANVATVANGVVTAVGAGTATITAKTVDGSNLTATCEVTVAAVASELLVVEQTNKPAQPDATISAGKLTLFTNGTYEVDSFYAGLGAAMKFEGEYVIENGELSFPGEIPVEVFGIGGVARVTATVAGKKIIVNVEVVGAEPKAAIFTIDEAGATTLGLTLGEAIAVTGITSSATGAIELEVGRTVDIGNFFTVAPEDASDKSYTVAVTEGNDFGGVNGTIVTGDAVGVMTLTATTADGGFTATITINVVELADRTRPEAFDAAKVLTSDVKFMGKLLDIMPVEFIFYADGTYDYNRDQTVLGGVYASTPGFYTFEATEEGAIVKLLLWTNMEKDGTYNEAMVETITWTKTEDGKWTFNYQGMIDMTEEGGEASTPVQKPRPAELGSTYFAAETVFTGKYNGMFDATLTFQADGTATIDIVIMKLDCYYSYDEATQTLKYVALNNVGDDGSITDAAVNLVVATVSVTDGVMSFTDASGTYTQQIG